MKILKSMMLGLALVIACTAAKADGKPTKAEVLNIFMDASAHGKIRNLYPCKPGNYYGYHQRLESNKGEYLCSKQRVKILQC